MRMEGAGRRAVGWDTGVPKASEAVLMCAGLLRGRYRWLGMASCHPQLQCLLGWIFVGIVK